MAVTAINLDSVADDRRGQRAQHRSQVQRLLALAEHLPDDERLLVQAVYERGESLQNLARLAGCPRSRLQQRLARAVRRSQQPLFQFCCRHMPLLCPTQQRVARQHILHGQSLRDTARQTGLSLHQVRQSRTALVTLARAGAFSDC